MGVNVLANNLLGCSGQNTKGDGYKCISEQSTWVSLTHHVLFVVNNYLSAAPTILVTVTEVLIIWRFKQNKMCDLQIIFYLLKMWNGAEVIPSTVLPVDAYEYE